MPETTAPRPEPGRSSRGVSASRGAGSAALGRGLAARLALEEEGPQAHAEHVAGEGRHQPHPAVQAAGGDAAEVGADVAAEGQARAVAEQDRKSTRLNSSHVRISYAVFCLKKKKPPLKRCTQ